MDLHVTDVTNVTWDPATARYIPERLRLLSAAVEAVRVAQVRHSQAEDAYQAGRITQEQWYAECRALEYYQQVEHHAKTTAALEVHTW